jgi:hypothetical protein
MIADPSHNLIRGDGWPNQQFESERNYQDTKEIVK